MILKHSLSVIKTCCFGAFIFELQNSLKDIRDIGRERGSVPAPDHHWQKYGSQRHKIVENLHFFYTDKCMIPDLSKMFLRQRWYFLKH
jgi:hypothetical protein